MDKVILGILGVLYMFCARASFGHSAHKANNETDIVAMMNAVTFGVAWPLYASYIYFEEEKTYE